jgi:NTP pyrophosphatase (non-canonical NTP hydrolase)
MKANEYQKQAMKFAKYGHADYPFLALGEEAGEVLGKLAKYVRKNNVCLEGALCEAKHRTGSNGFELYWDLVKELGDVLWQVSACCNELGVDLDGVMAANLGKLGDREARGVVVGIGDNR